MDSKSSKRISLLVTVSLCFYIILLGVNSFVNVFFTNTTIDSIVMYGLYALLIMVTVIPIVKKMNKWCIIMCFILAPLAIISMLHYGYDLIGKNVVNFLFTVVPFIFVGASISVTKSLETYFQRFILITAAAVAMQIIGNFISGATYVHDMTASYSALPSAIIAIYFMFRNKKQPVYVVLNIVYFFEILYMGVRGPIGIYFVCLLISILYFTKTRKARIVTSLTFVICAALFMSGTIERWLLMANRQLAALGINNGALIRYLNGTIIGDNGRSVITEKVIYAIWEHPILGNGLFYDRVLLGDNNYAHNLITEVLMDFGIFFGTIVLVVIAVCLIKLFTSARKDPFKFMFLLSLTAASIGLLTLSGSYLENRVFFMLVGIMMNQGFYKESIKEIGMDSTCLAV